MLHISPYSSTSPEALELLCSLASDFDDRYGEVTEPDGIALTPRTTEVFLLAWFGDQAVGCARARLLDPTTARVLDLYVRPQFRGRGIGRELLRTLEAHARDLGVSRLVTDTGARQPEAAALFEHNGFSRIDAPATHPDRSTRRRFEKAITLASQG